MTREEIRAWVKDLGLSEMKPLYADEQVDGPFEAFRGPGVITPADADEIVIHSADQAHALGFNGTGVRIAVIDSGVDFTHPDLLNVTARVEDPASPYFLHPIAYLGGSLNDYLIFGSPSPTLPLGENQPLNSWFVNTSFNTTVFEAANGTQWVNWTDGTIDLSWNVTGEGLTTGEEVRLGFHPDDKFLPLFGMRPGVLLINSTGAGFDQVLVDLDVDLSFVGEKRAWINTDWATFDPRAEMVTKDLNVDGWPDLSGGMLTFISDGVREIPYASGHIEALRFYFRTVFNDNAFDIWADIGANPTANVVPAAGDLVLLMGDFDLPEPVGTGGHGSWLASTIAGQGITGGFGGGPVISGMAPGAKIIAVGGLVFPGADPFVQTGLWTGQIFATVGYDNLADTGDEAHLASISWGRSDQSGWDFGGRFMDYVSNVLADERILFVAGAGNSGPGYGNPFSPAGAPGIVTSGSMDNWLHRDDPWFDFENGTNPSYGDLTSFSTRGPSVLGRHKVDALTSGRGYSADPLNHNPFELDSGTALDGNSSWIQWQGTSLSTPNLAGVLALIYDAYMAAHGGLAPLASTAKTILKNAADDAHLDPFLAGAGIANALRGVLIANETDGLSLNMNEWNVGDYGGVDYPAYANILFPGGTDMVSVDMTNHRPSASMAVDVVDTVVALNGSLSMDFTRTPGTAPEEFILNETGLYALNGTLLVPAPAGLFTSADFLRVSMWIDRSRMTEEDVVYRTRLLDWTDVNANGSFDGFDEENLMHRDGHIVFFDDIGPNGFGFIQDPANRTHDGLVIRLEVRFEALLTSDLTFELQVDYYKRTDFPWLEIVGPSSFVIPAASTSTVDLSVTLPGDADPGLYEAVVLFNLDNGDVATLPVVVNVAASGLPMFFGGNTHDAGVYQQGLQYGAADVIDSGSGDYRYYFLDLPEAATMTVLLEWDDEASSNDLSVLTNVTDWFSENAPARYGPGTEEEVGFAESGSNALSVTASLSKGLSIIVSRSTHLAGISVEEHPVGRAGVIDVSPPALAGVGVPVDGTQTFTITSDLEFPDVAVTVETGEVLVFLDQPVDPFPFAGQDPFEQYLFEAPNTLQTSVEAGVQRATYELFFHSGARDVDMGVFYDADCDGIYTLADDAIGSVASTGANPEIASVINPAAGCYWVHAAGFDVDSGSLYDLTFSVVTQPFIFPVDVPASIPVGVPTDLTVDYALPRIPMAFGGDFFVGSSQFPRAITIPVDLTPDLPPLFANEAPKDVTVPTASPTISVDMSDFPDAFEGEIDVDTVEVTLDGVDVTLFAAITPTAVTLQLPFVLAEGAHSVTVEAADLTGSGSSTSWSFSVDTVIPTIVITKPDQAITNDPDVVIEGLADSSATLTVNGTEVSVVFGGKFSTTLTLPEGAHSIDVVSTDAAGNSFTVTVDIEVDLTAPALTLTSPTDGASVEVATVTVAGTTEPGATVTVNGVVVVVDSNGAFSIEQALSPGANTITAVATDAAGNSGSASVSVTFSDPIPGLRQDLDNANSDLSIAQDALQLQLFLAIAIAAIGLVLAAVLFVLRWSARKGP